MSTIDSIGALLGVLIGGFITLVANLLNNRQAIKMRVLDEQLSAYRKIAREIISTKIVFEENLGNMAKARLSLDKGEISKEEFEERSYGSFDNLENSYNKFYKLFYYAPIIDIKVFDNIKLLYESMSRALSPSYIFSGRKFAELVSVFNNSLSSISRAIGTNRKGTLIAIPNPHVLVHRAFEENEEDEQ